MKALLYEGPQKVQLKEVPIPQIGDGEALVAVEACGLCGTDIVKIMNGRHRPPLPLGHEVSGRVHALGSGVKGFKVGDRVMVAHHVPCGQCHFCRRLSETMCVQFKESNLDPGGFSEYVRVSERHVRHTMLKLPRQVDFFAASQVEPLACCLRNLRRLALEPDDWAIVVGLGSIGLMTAQLLRLRGVNVLAFDLESARVRLAQKSGIEHSYTGKDGRSEELVRTLTGYRGADALILTAGTPSLAAERLSWIRDGGTLNIFASFHPDPHMRLDLNAVYHRELKIVASYSATPQDLREALELIGDKAIDLAPYTGHTFGLSSFPEALRRARGREVLKAILTPRSAR